MAQFSSRTPYSFSAPSIYYGRNMIDDQQINNGYDGTSRLPDIHFQKQLMDKIHTLELENSELREAVGNLRRENGNLRSKLRQESDIRGTRMILLIQYTETITDCMLGGLGLHIYRQT